jgi:hypothetical protein
MCDSGEATKKPRLFYWEEVEDAWVPAGGLDMEAEIIGGLDMLRDDEEVEIRFKRIDMSDDEFNNLPEI